MQSAATLAPRLKKENPQAIGALGVSALIKAALAPWGRRGIGAHARAKLTLAARHREPLLPFGPGPLHLGMRRFYPAGLRLPGVEHFNSVE